MPDNERDQIIETACRIMHDAYESAAVREGWETQRASQKPWEDVPDANKATMRAAVGALMDAGLLRSGDDTGEVAKLRAIHELHRPVDYVPHQHFFYGSDKKLQVCEHCTDLLMEADGEGGYGAPMFQPWPCPTAKVMGVDK